MPTPYLQEFVDLPVPPRGDGVPYRSALHVYPDPGPQAPVVVIWPALGAPAAFYRPFAQALSDAGVAVIVADLRGTGASTPAPTRADRYGYPDLSGDVGHVLQALKPRLDGRRHYLLGHSLGAQMCALHLARGGSPDLTGFILVAVGLPYFRYYTSWSWPRRLGLLGVTQTITAITAVARIWPGWAFGGRAARRVMLDWGFSARHGRFPSVDGAPVDLSRVSVPVLAISVPRDQLTPAPTLDALCSGFAGPVQRVRLEGDLDHFSWVRTPASVAEHVVRFVS